MLFGFEDPLVGAGFLQRTFHFFNRDELRIINHRVDLFKPELVALNALLHFFNAVEPFQGCFADIVSGHMEGHQGICNELLIRGDSAR